MPTYANDLGLDLSGTVFAGSNPRVLNSGGTYYLVGSDTHGWVTISHVELYELEDGDGYGVETVGEYPHASFPEKAKLLAAIEEA